MSLLKPSDSLLVLGLNLGKSHIPILIEFLILLDVSLLYFLAFTGLVVDKLLSSSLEVLSLELLNAVLGHFSL